MKGILIVGSATSEIGRSITQPLRAMQRGLVNCYFGNKFGQLLEDGIDWPNVSLLLLALSLDSQNKDSPLFKVELAILKGAGRHRVPIGIICDKHGKVSAPHLSEISDEITIVVAQSINEGMELGALYSNAVICTPKGEKLDPHDVAETIRKLLPVQRVIGERVVSLATREKTGFHDDAMTD